MNHNSHTSVKITGQINDQVSEPLCLIFVKYNQPIGSISEGSHNKGTLNCANNIGGVILYGGSRV